VKPQPRSGRSSRADSKNANRVDEQPSGAIGQIIRAVDVAAIPIEDPFVEKSLADKDPGTLCFYLSRNTGCGRISALALRDRIIEIYRRCYERSDDPEEVICDFVAAYPQLAFDAVWLKVLVETQAANRDFRPDGPRNSLFRALTTGFRRVANPEPRVRRSMRDAQMEAARFALRDIRKDLDGWERTLERGDATPEWINQRANAKAMELVTHPRLERHQERLKQLLRQGKHYQASIFIAGKIYSVRTRDLESRQS
jgi:hypothetical protein